MPELGNSQRQMRNVTKFIVYHYLPILVLNSCQQTDELTTGNKRKVLITCPLLADKLTIENLSYF